MAENTKKSKKTNKGGLTAPKKVKLLFTIINRDKTDFYLDVLSGFEINVLNVVYGHGTASKELLQYIGLADKSKTLIIGIIKEQRIKEIMDSLEDKFKKVKHGKGIAFTVPISSVIGVMAYQYISNTIVE